ncbi:hypothetical protein AgCh_011665 [Apium graveolens]
MKANPLNASPINPLSAKEEKEPRNLSVLNEMQIVVDFTATWCGPCRIMSPYFAELAKSMSSAIFLKVDVDELKSVAEEYDIEAMPTFMLLKEGKVVEKVIGAKKEELQQTIAKHLNVSA